MEYVCVCVGGGGLSAQFSYLTNTFSGVKSFTSLIDSVHVRKRERTWRAREMGNLAITKEQPVGQDYQL